MLDFNRLGILLSILMFIGLVLSIYSNIQLKQHHERVELSVKNDSLRFQILIDSLNNEIFIQKTNVERYEIAHEMLKEVDRKAYDNLQFILSAKTE